MQNRTSLTKFRLCAVALLAVSLVTIRAGRQVEGGETAVVSLDLLSGLVAGEAPPKPAPPAAVPPKASTPKGSASSLTKVVDAKSSDAEHKPVPQAHGDGAEPAFSPPTDAKDKAQSPEGSDSLDASKPSDHAEPAEGDAAHGEATIVSEPADEGQYGFLSPSHSDSTSLEQPRGAHEYGDLGEIQLNPAGAAPLGQTESEATIGIRIDPYPDTLRVVILLDEATPYVLQIDPARRRATLELIGLEFVYFQSDLNEINDPRVEGIWLASSGPEASILEFRLSRDDIDVDDFSTTDPPAIILEFFTPDMGENFRPGRSFSFRIATRTPQAQSDAGHEATVASADNPAGGPVFSSSLPDMFGNAGISDVTDTHGAAAHVAESHGVQTHVAESHGSEHASAEGHIVSAVEDARIDEFQIRRASASVFGAIDRYNGFPIHEIEMETAGGEAILAYFKNLQWGNVLTEGLRLLDTNPETVDLSNLLYLLAEARSRIGAGKDSDIVLDHINFYEQALFHGANPRLSAFAHARLLQLNLKAGRPSEALYHLNASMPGATGTGRIRLRAQRVKILDAISRTDEALELADSLMRENIDLEIRLDLAAFQARQALGEMDYAKAWKILNDPNLKDTSPGALTDFQWWQMSPEDAELYGSVADKMGELETARQAYRYAAYTFEDLAWDRPGMYLAYADLLRRMSREALNAGDSERADKLDEEAYHWYLRILGLVEPSDTDAQYNLEEAKQALRDRYSVEITTGSASFALYHLSHGEIEDAMRQLRKAQQQSILTASSSEPLTYAINQILEPYMRRSFGAGDWHDVLAAWKSFGAYLEEGESLNACRGYIARAMAEIGLNSEALILFESLLELEEGSGIPTRDVLFVWKAKLLNRMGRGEEAIEELEVLARSKSLANIGARAAQALAEIYESSGKTLLAAQAQERIARDAELDARERGNAWLKAGDLYLGEGLPHQAQEIMRRALIFEAEYAGRAEAPPWPVNISKRIRMTLARAFAEQNDYKRSAMTLENYLAQAGLTPEERGLGNYMLGESRRQMGRPDAARTAYESAINDDEIPEVWRKASTEALRAMTATLRAEDAESRT